jgi:hypothetical protein
VAAEFSFFTPSAPPLTYTFKLVMHTCPTDQDHVVATLSGGTPRRKLEPTDLFQVVQATLDGALRNALTFGIKSSRGSHYHSGWQLEAIPYHQVRFQAEVVVNPGF